MGRWWMYKERSDEDEHEEYDDADDGMKMSMMNI